MNDIKEYEVKQPKKTGEPFAALEKTFILNYLKSRGHTWKSVKALPKDEARQLLRNASIFASNKLAEIETRAKLVRELHDDLKPFE